MESNRVTGARISEARAIRVAAEAAQVAGLPAAAHFVERLDGQHPYFLVHFGEPGGRGAAVMVDARDGSVMARAAAERVEQPWLMKQERAAEIAGCAQPVEARLVWKPSRATRSPFYPLWEVSTASGRVWVDQSGRVWRELSPAGPG
ncbi:MAG TPA: hypothetical protein VL523_16610 [Terriglobia bacterium]|nr:hypothetical protein [Terriglobia bacterium]